MVENPWLVESIHDFSSFQCPECIFTSKEEPVFKNHAIENHPLSIEFFGGKYEEECYEDDPIKDELAIKEESEIYFDNEYIDGPEVSIDEFGSFENADPKEEQGLQLKTENLKIHTLCLCLKKNLYSVLTVQGWRKLG